VLRACSLLVRAPVCCVPGPSPPRPKHGGELRPPPPPGFRSGKQAAEGAVGPAWGRSPITSWLEYW
jgi:hypothetical protein